MTKEPKTVTINDKEYNIDDLTDEQKVMLNHITDLDRKLNTTLFNADQLKVGMDSFVALLAQSLENPEVPEAEVVN